MLLGSLARSSGEFGTKFRVFILAGSQDFLPDIGNIQSGDLRVVAGVRTVREGPTFTYSLKCTKKLDLSGLKARTRSRDDMNNTFRRHLVNHVTLRVTTRYARAQSSKHTVVCQYQLTTNAFISSKDHPQPEQRTMFHQSARWSGPSVVNNKQDRYRYKELTAVDIAVGYTVRSKFRHNLSLLRVFACPCCH